MEQTDTVFVAGHKGLVGSAIIRALRQRGHTAILTADRQSVDLTRQSQVEEFFASNSIQYVFLAAAKVGGILYNNSYQADFLYENMMIAANVMHAAAETNVEKLLFLGSSCIYPKHAPQPLHETALLSGPLEPTNEGYALAKIAGLKLCEKYQMQYSKRFISAMPTNLYGPGDNFHPTHSHVIPGMLRRFHEAKLAGQPSVEIWGTGSPRREFLHVDDCAKALCLLMDKYEEPTTINVGTGEDVTILELAQQVKETVGYKGEIVTDPSKPDGTPRKVLDVSRLKGLGWSPSYSLSDGLKTAYNWALDQGILEGA